jgi:hypothetical protein
MTKKDTFLDTIQMNQIRRKCDCRCGRSCSRIITGVNLLLVVSGRSASGYICHLKRHGHRLPVLPDLNTLATMINIHESIQPF